MLKRDGIARLTALGLSAVLAAATSSALADESEAKSLVKAMSDYLAAQKTVSFDYESSLDIVAKDGQKLALVSSGSISLSRPDKIRATRSGGFADVDLV